MSGRKGFTLVELVIVIVIFGFLMAMGAPAFSTWQRKHAVEGQIEKLYSDLQFARMKAYAEKVTCGLWWGATLPFTAYQIRRDNSSPPNGNITDSGDANPQSAFSLKYPTNCTIQSIAFDTRGFTSDLATLSITPSFGASIDCISVSRTRIRLGKTNAAGTCDPK